MSRSGLYHPVTIGSVTIQGNCFLAPLAGYTDRAFRSLCLLHGANFTYTEMVSAEGLARDSEKTIRLMDRAENEPLFAVQIFTDTSEAVRRSLPNLLKAEPTIIDINCGCPVPKVVKTGAGSALLKTPEIIHDMVRTITNHCDTPVSVKIRLGWDQLSINWKETTDAALSAGATMITMHARTRSQGYGGTAAWEEITQLKQWVLEHYPSVPVFASGDIMSAEAAKQALEETGADGVMFARGAIGNPFIFEEAKALLMTGQKRPLPSLEERIDAILTQLHLLSKDKGEVVAAKEMRKHACSYLKGIPKTGSVKLQLVSATTLAHYRDILYTFLAERQ